MPASLMGNNATVNGTGNPSAGPLVFMDALSGPKGSPLDNDVDGNASTGALSTGIGFGGQVIGTPTGGSSPQSIRNAGFTDDVGPGGGAADSTILYIGGGRTVNAGAPGFANVAGVAGTDPYNAGFNLVAAGNGASRDLGAGPEFTGAVCKWVTAAGAVATGAAVETGFVNRSGVALVAGDNVLGQSTTAQAAPS